MKIFVAGASGAIGRPLVRQLLAAGHEVTGMTRREDRAEQIRATGATAVVCDALDAERLRAALAGVAPEVVVHMLTALPPRIDWKADPFGPTNRLREEGTRNLIAAASAAGTRRFLAESIAFLYAPQGGWVKDEEAKVSAGAPEPFGAVSAALASLEQQVGESPEMDGLVLRFGWLYGPGTSFAADGSQAEDVRRRRFPIVGRGAGTFSFVHVDDAAAATVAALDRGAPGIYNIVDDEPAPQREWLPVYAEALGARVPRRVPAWLAKLIVGRAVVDNVSGLRGASNAKARRELSWEPSHRSWRRGFVEGLG